MRNKIYYFLCGLAMGAADTIPGVSGGTIAFITGIYEKLLQNITSIGATFFQLIHRRESQKDKNKIAWDFVIPLILGIVTAIFSLANIVVYLMDTHKNFVWAFFFGLVLASLLLLLINLLNIRGYATSSALLFITGTILSLWITYSNPIALEHSYLTIFCSGFVAICAMILPGISGAFLLVLLGQYQFILQSVADMDFFVIIVFGMGTLCGLFSFTRLIRLCLERYNKPSLAFLSGILAGSLAMLFPFSNNSWQINNENILLCVFIGIGIVIPLGLHKVQQKFFASKKDS